MAEMDDLQTPDAVCRELERMRKGEWTSGLDREIIQWVEAEGQSKWSDLSRFLAREWGCVRSARELRERYQNVLGHLDRAWTHEEDIELAHLFQEYGKQWGIMARRLSRSEASVHNRLTMRERKAKEDAPRNAWPPLRPDVPLPPKKAWAQESWGPLNFYPNQPLDRAPLVDLWTSSGFRQHGPM
jgi:hypothetical protein